MLLLILNVVYVLLAIAMIALILMQRGAGAQAGSGFGAGASGHRVRLARRVATSCPRAPSGWRSRSSRISLFMAWHATHSAAPGPAQQDLGVMGQVPAAPQQAPAGSATVPTAPAQPAPAHRPCRARRRSSSSSRGDRPGSACAGSAAAAGATASGWLRRAKIAGSVPASRTLNAASNIRPGRPDRRPGWPQDCPDGGIGRRTTLRW